MTSCRPDYCSARWESSVGASYITGQIIGANGGMDL
jgi:hypothetical protein